MTNFTNKLVKRLLYDEQKQWHNENNSSIFQNALLSKGATTYRYPISSTAGLDEKLLFLGNENQINHFNANPADIAKNIMVSRYGPQWEQVGADIFGDNLTDKLGQSVCLSADGSVMAVGAPYFDNNSGSYSTNIGQVKIYNYHNNRWQQKGVDIIGEANGDIFGQHISLNSNGSIVAIGAGGNDGNGDQSGHVRVYEYIDNSWQQKGQDIDGEATLDGSGKVHLSADGLTVAIGAKFNMGTGSGNLNVGKGHVRVYKFQNNLWSQYGNDIDGLENSENIGSSVSLSLNGNIVAVGGKGIVRVYKFDNSNNSWSQQGGDIVEEAPLDYAGLASSLSADGSIIAIGAMSNDGNGENSGHVRVYQRDPDSQDTNDQNSPNYGPLGWRRLGNDIDGENAGDYSGWSVSLSADGLIVAIGAIYSNDNGNESGHVRVFNYNDNSWIQHGLDIEGLASGDNSGMSLSLSADGSVVAIGADSNENNGYQSGHVRVFQIAKKNLWVQQGLDIDGEAPGDESGFSISLSGDGSLLAIGSYMANEATGNVRVYRNEIGLWKQVGSNIEGGQVGEYSGAAISLTKNGSVLAIGAESFNNYRGKVRVFENSNNSWTQLGFDINGEEEENTSGWSVSCVDGRDENKPLLLAISAISNDDNGLRSGHVRVYEYREYTLDDIDENDISKFNHQSTLLNTNQEKPLIITSDFDTPPEVGSSYWIQVGKDIDGEGAADRSGESVSFSSDGTTLAIGATGNDNDNGSNSGHVRVYRFDNETNNWKKFGDDIDGETAGDASGVSVSLNSDGTILAIGAILNDGNGDNSGHVRVYKNISGSWQQIGSDIDGEASDDRSGWSVSLSSDGTILAIGAILNDGNGDNSGHVRVYKNISGSWQQIGSDIDGEGAGDRSGCSVSLSSDGTILSIGAQYNHGPNGIESGHTRVYKFSGWGLGT